MSLDKISRVYKRAKSPSNFSKLVAEEMLVRAWSIPTVRSASSFVIRDYNPPKWVFLVGCFNSGTTLLQNILGSHPDMSSMPREGVRFTGVLSNLEENDHHMIWDESYESKIEPNIADLDAYKKIKKDWGIFWHRNSNAFLDKSIANTARIEWLNRVFPNAYFIGIHRNGYCVTEGLRRRANPPEWYKRQTGSDQYSYETIANQWVIANTLMHDKLQLIPNGLTIRFEDLVEKPEETITSCLRFLKLDTSAMSCVGQTLHMNKSKFEIHDPNAASLARLDNEAKIIAKPILAPMMLQLDYKI